MTKSISQRPPESDPIIPLAVEDVDANSSSIAGETIEDNSMQASEVGLGHLNNLTTRSSLIARAEGSHLNLPPRRENHNSTVNRTRGRDRSAGSRSPRNRSELNGNLLMDDNSQKSHGSANSAPDQQTEVQKKKGLIQRIYRKVFNKAAVKDEAD